MRGWPIDDDLAETDFGSWEGLTFAEVMARWPDEMAAWMADADAAPPGGESFAAVAGARGRALDRLLAAHRGKTVVVVSHVTPIKTHRVPRAARATRGAVPDSPGRRVAVGGRLVRRRTGLATVSERHRASADRTSLGPAFAASTSTISARLGSLF